MLISLYNASLQQYIIYSNSIRNAIQITFYIKLNNINNIHEYMHYNKILF